MPAILAGVAALAAVACHSLDDDRIPVYPVNIVFSTVAEWDVYGLSGAMRWKTFDRDRRQPSNFPFTATTYTGFGGVLLVTDVAGTPHAYDLACPVERQKNVLVHIDADNEFLATCDKCGSTYNVFSLMGHPVGGPAARDGFAMRRYRVQPGRGGEYMVVGN